MGNWDRITPSVDRYLRYSLGHLNGPLRGGQLDYSWLPASVMQMLKPYQPCAGGGGGGAIALGIIAGPPKISSCIRIIAP